MEISNELLAAYVEGFASEAERKAVRKYLTNHPKELETIMIMMDEDYDIQLDNSSENAQRHTFNFELNDLLNAVDLDESDSKQSVSMSILPMLSMAAENIIDNLCAIRCEGIAMRQLGINIGDDELIKESKEKGLIKQEGMALYNIGKLSGDRGLNVAHRYKCSIEDIKIALSDGNVVLAVVDSEELKTKETKSIKQQEETYRPNHVVIVKSVTDNDIKIIDSSTSNQEDFYSISHFAEAWNDSSNYLIVISKNNKYEPHPIDLSDVTISDDLLELREAIAENAHEVWAYNRQKEGWKYGPFRDDAKKQHPDMIAYNRLPESEKKYDREMAMNTIKLVQKLGWEIKKRQ